MARLAFATVSAVIMGLSTEIGHASPGPVAVRKSPAIPAPVDRAFGGTINLRVDATDTMHNIFVVHETIPIQIQGDRILLYPEWELGSHAPTASVAELAGLLIHAGNVRVDWYRDPVNVHAFHIAVPQGVTSITADFEFLSQSRYAFLRPDMVEIQWHRLLLYPAGYYARDIPIAARVSLPKGLHAFTSLTPASNTNNIIDYKTTSLERLVDSPVYAGRNWRQIDLSPGSARPVMMDVVSDRPSDLAAPREETARMRALVAQASKVFGPAPFAHYDAIITLSDELSPGGGVEHSAEGENNLPSNYFTNLPEQLNNRDLIAHEFVHAWNGRARIPADLWSPNFNEPVQDSLLWVYEGQTEFWGRVLAARAGLRTRGQTLDKLALDAAITANRRGRSWKTLADSNNDAIYMAGRAVEWRDWQRREDYYLEGVILWLNVDARIRELSHGRRNLDDFASRFFSSDNRPDVVSSYTFQDVCNALEATAPTDWSTFLHHLLLTHDDQEAISGLDRAGWKLVYTDFPSETFQQDEADAGIINLDYSIGLRVRENGSASSVVWDSPAFRAGISPGAHILLVGSERFSRKTIKEAVASSVSRPLMLEIAVMGQTKLVLISYRGPLRYPRLERAAGRPDWLSPLLTPR